MVRCIPTFVILGLIASLTCNHPISIDNVDEIVETAGIQAADDVVEDIFATQPPFDNNDAVETADVYNIVDAEEAVPSSAPFVVDIEAPTDTVIVQAVDIEEPTEIENSTAGVQAVAEEIEEDIVAGIQGVEDVEEEDIVVAEAPSAADEIVAQAAGDQDVDENEAIEFELFEEGEEADDEMTAAGDITEEINSVQNNAPLSDAEKAAHYENLALEALNRLKILHIFRSNRPYKPNKFYRGMKKEKREIDDEENIQSVFDIPEATEAPAQEAEIPEEVPTDVVQQVGLFEVYEPKEKKCIGERCEEEDEVEIALFEVEAETGKNDYETVTEMVTEVHVVSAVIDDEDQPTIGAIAIDPVQDQDVEEEIPLFGVIEEIDDEEVQIAKKDEVFVEISYEIVEVSSEQQTPAEETTESLVISGVLIDLTEQEQQSEAVATEAATEAATDVAEEEPTIIN